MHYIASFLRIYIFIIIHQHRESKHDYDAYNPKYTIYKSNHMRYNHK